MMNISKIACLTVILATTTHPAFAQETQKFTYDAKGRLIKVEYQGGANDGAKTEYTHDKAHNRKRVKVEGASERNPTQ
jgi:YD repeat-containing protein